MKKKGFTLVELLAVIAILAILVIIALPNVMGMFNEAKKNSFTTEVKEVFKIAQQQWISDSMFDTSDKVYTRCKTCTGKELDLSGRTELDYYIKINKAGNVIKYYATDGTYQFGYSGDGLAIENIRDVEQVSEIDESNVITITPSGVEEKTLFCYITSKKPNSCSNGGCEDDWVTLAKTYIEYEDGMNWEEFLDSNYNMKNGRKIFDRNGNGLYPVPDTYYTNAFFTCLVNHIDNPIDGCYSTMGLMNTYYDTPEILDKNQMCYGNIPWST